MTGVNSFLMEPIAVLSLLMLLSSGPGIEAAVDWTIKNNASGTEVVETVVDAIQQSCIFPDDRLMLRRIAAVESADGQSPTTFSVPHFYGGIWQINKTSFTQTKFSANNTVYSLINSTFKINWKTVDYKDLVKPLYSGLAARLRIASHYQTSDIPQDVQTQAQYWAQRFTTNSWGHLATAVELYTNASRRTDKVCSSPKADVIFVLDSSGSISSEHFTKVRQFVVNVVQSFNIRRDGVRVALVQFSDDARVEFNLTAYNTTAQVVSVASAIPYMSSGTNTVAGLQSLESVVNSEGRLGAAVPVVAILMTDGQSNDKPATLLEAARIHRTLANKMTVFSIGVGTGIDSTELEAIASQPSCQHVFHLASFNDVTAFAYQIMKRACDEPAPLTEYQHASVTLKAGEKTHLEASTTIRKKRSAFEITVKAKQGKEKSRAKVYASCDTPKPNAAKHDVSFDVGGTGKQQVTEKVPCKSENSVNRRGRRDVNNSTADADDDVTDSPMTLYMTIEGLGNEEEDGNSFDVSYTVVEFVATDEPETWTSSASASSGPAAKVALSSAVVLLIRHFSQRSPT